MQEPLEEAWTGRASSLTPAPGQAWTMKAMARLTEDIEAKAWVKQVITPPGLAHQPPRYWGTPIPSTALSAVRSPSRRQLPVLLPEDAEFPPGNLSLPSGFPAYHLS